MKSLPSALLFTLKNHAASGSNRRALGRLGLAAILCCAVPLTVVYAQDPVPAATGTVTCAEMNFDDGTISETKYAVQMIGNTIIGRWGLDKDVSYSSQIPYFDEEIPTQISIYFYSMSDPDNFNTFEELYSETGKWDLKADLKKSTLTIRGISFTMMDYPFDDGWLHLGAECAWKLVGPLPAE